MVALSLQAPTISQKTRCSCGYPGSHHVGKNWYCDECYINGDDEEEQEKAHDPVRGFNDICNNLRGYLHHIMLLAQRRLGVTR